MKSDIILRQNRIEAVTANNHHFGVTTAEGGTPDIKMSPNSASLTLGGGDGEYSDGDLRLHNRPDDKGRSKPRIHLTGGKGKTHSGTRVRVDGGDGDVLLGAESTDTPDIKLLPNWASLTLGGGGGENSDGDIKLMDRPDEEGNADPRIHLTGGKGSTFSGTRVRVDGRQGNLSLAADSADDPDIRLRPQNSALGLGGGGAEAANGTVKLFDDDGKNRVHVDSEGIAPDSTEETSVFISGGGSTRNDELPTAGVIRLGEAGEALYNSTITLHGDRGKISAGNVDSVSGEITSRHEEYGDAISLEAESGEIRAGTGSEQQNDELGVSLFDGVAGRLALENAGGNETVSLDSAPDEADGAELSLTTTSGVETVDVRGGAGDLVLGTDRQTIDRNATGVGVQTINGRLALGDGVGMMAELVADDGTVSLGHQNDSNEKVGVELEPQNGLFRVVDGGGNAVFEIDTKAKEIRESQAYDRVPLKNGS